MMKRVGDRFRCMTLVKPNHLTRNSLFANQSERDNCNGQCSLYDNFLKLITTHCIISKFCSTLLTTQLFVLHRLMAKRRNTACGILSDQSWPLLFLAELTAFTWVPARKFSISELRQAQQSRTSVTLSDQKVSFMQSSFHIVPAVI